MAVTHCLCERRSFADILRWAKARGGADQKTIEREMGCGGHCGMCKPFIQYALVTGETSVPWPCPEIPASAAN